MGAQASKSTPPGEAFAGLAHSVVTCSSGASHSSPTPSSSGCNVRILEPAGAAKADSDSTCSLPGDGERAALADAEGQDCGWQQAGQVQLLSQVRGPPRGACSRVLYVLYARNHRVYAHPRAPGPRECHAGGARRPARHWQRRDERRPSARARARLPRAPGTLKHITYSYRR